GPRRVAAHAVEYARPRARPRTDSLGCRRVALHIGVTEAALPVRQLLSLSRSALHPSHLLFAGGSPRAPGRAASVTRSTLADEGAGDGIGKPCDGGLQNLLRAQWLEDLAVVASEVSRRCGPALVLDGENHSADPHHVGKHEGAVRMDMHHDRHREQEVE